MTTPPNAKSPLTDDRAEIPEPLPDPPPDPDGMQQEPHTTEIRSILRRRYAHRPDVLVSGEGYLCYDTHDPADRVVPDCVVAFDVDAAAIFNRNGYVIDDIGKPPDLVLEVASRRTGVVDYTRKREVYSRFRVSEYWRFDPTGGEYHDQPLAGDRLVNGVYQPIPLNYGTEGQIWGRSQVLGLDLCWEDGRLRWWDPAAQSYLLTFDEERDVRIAEAEARAAAEARADSAEARVRDLEAELERRGGG
jgi:Uma2 family endonuclease